MTSLSSLPLEIIPLVCAWLAQKDVVHFYYAIRESDVLSKISPYKRFPVFIRGIYLKSPMRVDVQKKSDLISTAMPNKNEVQTERSRVSDENDQTTRPPENRRAYVMNRIAALRTECRKCRPPTRSTILKGFIAGGGSERERRFSLQHTQRAHP